MLSVFGLALGLDDELEPIQEAPSALSGLTDDELFGIRDEIPMDPHDAKLHRLILQAHESTERALRKFGQYSAPLTIPFAMNHPRDVRGYVFELSVRLKQIIPTNSEFEFANGEVSNVCLLFACDESEQELLIAIPKQGLPIRLLKVLGSQSINQFPVCLFFGPTVNTKKLDLRTLNELSQPLRLIRLSGFQTGTIMGWS